MLVLIRKTIKQNAEEKGPLFFSEIVQAKLSYTKQGINAEPKVPMTFVISLL